MKKTLLMFIPVILLAIVFFSVPLNCHAQNLDNAISVGGGGGGNSDATESVFQLEYEKLLLDHLSMDVLIGALQYEYDDGWYWEDGKGYGIQLDLRFYPTSSGDGLQGPYLGAGFGILKTEWDWKDVPYFGDDDSLTTDLHCRIGYKFLLGSSGFFIDPSLQLGYWVSGDAKIDEYGVGLLSIGYAF